MSQVLEKAVELADALEECEELKEVKEKEEAVRADANAASILNSYFEMQHQMYHLQEEGKEPDPELLAQFNDIQNTMSENMVIAEYYKSQETLGYLLQKVNAIISKAITGEDPADCSDADCASCAGCH